MEDWALIMLSARGSSFHRAERSAQIGCRPNRGQSRPEVEEFGVLVATIRTLRDGLGFFV